MELRLALRRLLRQPAGSLAVVLALALALAVTSALFAVLDGLLFRPLPFPHPDQLMAVDYRQVDGQMPPLAFSAELAGRRAALHDGLTRSPLVAVAAQAGRAAFFDTGEAGDLGLEVEGVDAHFLPLLGLSPLLGVTFGADDERSATPISSQSSNPLPIIIGHALWQRLYGSDPAILGVRVLAGRSVRIIGVMGPEVKFPGETNVWAPIPSDRGWPPAYVRLAPGATIEQLAGVFPDLHFTALREVMHPGEVRALPLLFGAAVILLVVTWVQVTALMFSGSLGQLREIGVRLALGASRADVVRQFAFESALTAGASLGLAWLAIRPLTAFIVNMLPSELSRGQYLNPDLRTFLFCAAISVVGLVLLTLVPLRVVRRAAPLGLLTGRLSERPLRVERVRQLLLVGQMTLTALLLYVCGLAVHSFVQATTFNYGFDAEHVLVFTPPNWFPAGTTVKQSFVLFAESERKVLDSVERLHHVPGVIGASTFFAAPLRNDHYGHASITRLDGVPIRTIQARHNSVGVDFVRAFGATIVAGHGFDDPEEAGQDNLTIVNETLARRLSPPTGVMGQSLATPVAGSLVQLAQLDQSGRPLTLRVVGVIKDLVDSRPDVASDPQVFVLDRELARAIAIRVSPSVEAVLPAVRGSLEGLWGLLPSRQFSLMRDELNAVLVPYRGQSILLSLIAACCLPIAAIGLIGALTYSVRVRTREIAIRIAIGADPADVRRMVVRRALATVGVGSLLGVALGAATGSVIAHQLFEVHPADAWTMIGVTAGLMALGWLAAVVPARRASGVEPAIALRQE